MWLKSITALLWGFVLAVSLLLNISQMQVIAADNMLLIGLIGLFVLWVSVMVYCYSRNSVYHASLTLSKLFAISVFFNVVLLLVG